MTLRPTPSGRLPSAPTRLKSLDGLRGLAACGIAFLYHARDLFDPAALTRVTHPFQWFVVWGWTLVDLFFVLSGYVFAHVYLKGDRLSRDGLGDFAIARIARLYPLHLLMLVVCAVFLADQPGNTAAAFVAHLLMLQQFVEPVAHTFDGPTWSISVEVVCYVVFALAAVRGPRVLQWVSITAITVALAYFVVQGRYGGPWTGDAVPRGLLGFFAGQMVWRARATLTRVPSVALVGVLVCGLAIDTEPTSSILPLTLLAWPALVVLALRVASLGSAPLLWLGDRSYAIYLIHQPVLLLLLRFHGGLFHATPLVLGLIAVMYAAGVLMLADISYRVFETPARRWIHDAWQRRCLSVNASAPAA